MRYLIPILAFALFDFWGYNLSVKKKWVNEELINPYRIVQTAVQTVIIVLLLIFFDWKTSAVFIILWWTWYADWIYYALCVPFYFYCEKDEWKTPFRNEVTWAWWTPLGLIMGKGTIDWQWLFLQTLLGIGISILLTV